MRTTLVIAVALATSPRWASADPATATERAAEADAAAAAGDNARALGLYKQALALDDSPRYRCNVGIAYYKQQDWPRAHLHLALCLAHTAELDATAVAQMGQAYAFAERQLEKGRFAQLAIEVEPPAARVVVSAFGDDEPFPGNRTVWVPHGTHTVVARAPGYVAAEREVEVPARRSIAIALETEPALVAEPDGAGEPPAGDDPGVGAEPAIEAPVVEPPAERPAAPRERRSRTPAWISFGVAGGALLGGAVFHKLAIDAKRDAEELGAGPEFDALDERFERRRLGAVGLYAVAAVAAGVGTYLLVRGASDEGATVGVSLAPGGGAAVVGWAF